MDDFKTCVNPPGNSAPFFTSVQCRFWPSNFLLSRSSCTPPRLSITISPKLGFYNAKLIEIDLLYRLPGLRSVGGMTSPAGVLVGVVVRPAVAK